LVCDIIKDYMAEWQMLKEVLSLVWDMSCDLGIAYENFLKNIVFTKK